VAYRATGRVPAARIRPSHDYVFTGVEGGPLWPHRVTAQFTTIAGDLGLPNIRSVQGLRH